MSAAVGFLNPGRRPRILPRLAEASAPSRRQAGVSPANCRHGCGCRAGSVGTRRPIVGSAARRPIAPTTRSAAWRSCAATMSKMTCGDVLHETIRRYQRRAGYRVRMLDHRGQDTDGEAPVVEAVSLLCGASEKPGAAGIWGHGRIIFRFFPLLMRFSRNSARFLIDSGCQQPNPSTSPSTCRRYTRARRREAI